MITNTLANETQTLKGISRSRFSWHFNFFNKRRWLLVQFVSAPTITSTEENTSTLPYTHTAPRRGLTNTLEEYQLNRMQRALV